MFFNLGETSLLFVYLFHQIRMAILPGSNCLLLRESKRGKLRVIPRLAEVLC